MKNKILTKISLMDRPQHEGDWHDKPLRYMVETESGLIQKFSTKKDAELWARCYRKTGGDQKATFRLYLSK